MVMDKRRVILVITRNAFIMLCIFLYLSALNFLGWLAEGFYFFWDQSAGCGINSGMGNSCLILPFPYQVIGTCSGLFFIASLFIDLSNEKIRKTKYLLLSAFSALFILILIFTSPIQWSNHILMLSVALCFLLFPPLGLLLFLHLVKR